MGLIQLSYAEIIGFRGIGRLSLYLQPQMVLIGENSWGQSSLMAFLSLVLNPYSKQPYQFSQTDFHLDLMQIQPQPAKFITAFLSFTVNDTDNINPLLKKILVIDSKSQQNSKINLRINAKNISAENKIVTNYEFIDAAGKVINCAKFSKTWVILATYCAFYHISSQNCLLPDNLINKGPELQKLNSHTQKLIAIFLQLLRKYICNDIVVAPIVPVNMQSLWSQAKELSLQIEQDQSKQILQALKQQLLISLSLPPVDSLSEGKSSPTIVLENLDKQLHPKLAAIMCKLLAKLPLKKIICTSQLSVLSYLDITSLCRLVRQGDFIKVYQAKRQDLSKSDWRKIKFHIQYNNNLSLLAQMWLLVEGQTEVWLLNELAKMLDIDLAIEGIRVVEYAQTGIKPLIKYAQKMGIEWYALTDGDIAGKNYTKVVSNLVADDDYLAQRIVQLPKRDLEHFLYSCGFKDVFIKLAKLDVNQLSGKENPNKIIQRAITKNSKPDLILAILQEIQNRGVQSIPLLLKFILTRAVILAQQQNQLLAS